MWRDAAVSGVRVSTSIPFTVYLILTSYFHSAHLSYIILPDDSLSSHKRLFFIDFPVPVSSGELMLVSENLNQRFHTTPGKNM